MIQYLRFLGRRARTRIKQEDSRNRAPIRRHTPTVSQMRRAHRYRTSRLSHPKCPSPLSPQSLPRLDIASDLLFRQAIGTRPVRAARSASETMVALAEHFLHVRTRHRSEHGVRVHVFILGHEQLAEIGRLGPVGEVGGFGFRGFGVRV